MDALTRESIEAVLGRHERIALQLSGGRDSIACLYLLRPWLNRITVYRTNTRAAFPETEEVLEQLRAMIPHYVEIDGDQPGVIAQHGIPSDIVPASRTPIGLSGTGGTGQMIQDKYSCCVRAVMAPMHQQMIDDGITLIIRGQKNDDHHKAPVRSGHIEHGIEYLFPIEDWSNRQVMDYLKQEGAPVSRIYQVLNTTPECMTCSAWWEDGVAAYLKQYHPAEYTLVQQRLDIINVAVSEHIAHFNIEVQP